MAESEEYLSVQINESIEETNRGEIQYSEASVPATAYLPLSSSAFNVFNCFFDLLIM